LDNGRLPCTTGADGAAISGVVSGVVAVIVTSAGWSEAGGAGSSTDDTGDGSFVHSLVGPVGGAWTGGCGDATGASAAGSSGVAGTASGVAGNGVSALVSASAVLMRCQRLGSTAWGSVVAASGDMT